MAHSLYLHSALFAFVSTSIAYSTVINQTGKNGDVMREVRRVVDDLRELDDIDESVDMCLDCHRMMSAFRNLQETASRLHQLVESQVGYTTFCVPLLSRSRYDTTTRYKALLL